MKSVAVLVFAAFLMVGCVFPAFVTKYTVAFDMNYAGAPEGPEKQRIVSGEKAQVPMEVPSRTGYLLNGWYREAACVTAWRFDTDIVSGDQTLYAQWTAEPKTPEPLISIEFGRDNSRDYCDTLQAPSGGTLFSIWTKIPDDLSQYTKYGWLRGNMTEYTLYGENWVVMCLVGNIYRYEDYGEDGYVYNANTMLGFDNIWGGDYSYYQRPEWQQAPASLVSGWVWAAWQIIVGQDSMTFRQWLKFGVDGDVIEAGEDTVSFDAIRQFAMDPKYNKVPLTQEQAMAWTPTDATKYQIGYDHGYACHARLEARNTKPTLAELEAISKLNEADTSAWADYELNWVDGAPNLLDRSNHGFTLVLHDGGTLYEGVAGPIF